ncbi:DUF2330 domain-containing protein [bacterium]|nr:DUF2330 domain-containing protein [bacterium]
MKKTLLTALTLSGMASAACCYFAAVGKDVNQPGQRAFISWDEQEQVEAFTVQPQFKGNADQFGMVIPTPSQPKLQEMPKDFFRALAVFTILEPMDMAKYKTMMYSTSSRAEGGSMNKAAPPRPAVRILEHGIVGNLDYKILEADKPDALYVWLKNNKYNYGGDQATLDYYVKQKWNFTVMKIDPRQMKRDASGTFLGVITPTRFTFKTSKPIYPLRITQISVKDQTDVLLYVMARKKMDMDGNWSYEPNFLSMWNTAISFAVPDKLTPQEKSWQKNLAGKPLNPNQAGAQLEWAGKLTQARLDVLSGDAPYNRDAPKEEVARLKILRGHLKKDWYLTKFRKSFARAEMTHDIGLVPARYQGTPEDLEYVSILPTSPP